LIEQLFIHPYSKIEFLVYNLGIERKAASRYLNGLEEIGILKSQQKGKEVIYINTKLYNLLKKDEINRVPSCPKKIKRVLYAIDLVHENKT